MKNLSLLTIVVTIITVTFLLNSCSNGSNAGAAFKILLDPTLRTFVDIDEDPKLNDIIYSFNYKRSIKILVENPDEEREYKIWFFNYDSNHYKKIIDFEISSDEKIKCITLTNNNLNIYTQTEINRGLSILKRTYDVSTYKKISNEIVMSMVDSTEFDVDDFMDIFDDKETKITLSSKLFYKFPAGIKYDDFKITAINLIFDELYHFLQGIVTFASYKEKEDYLLISTFNKTSNERYDYYQHLKAKELKFDELPSFFSHLGKITKMPSPVFDKNDILINSYIKKDIYNNFKLCVQFFKDGIIKEETCEISYGDSKYQVRPKDVYYNYKIINDKLYFITFKSFVDVIDAIQSIELVNIAIYDLNTKKIINQKNKYKIFDEHYAVFYFFDFAVNGSGDIVMLFDGTKLYHVSAGGYVKGNYVNYVNDLYHYFDDLFLVSINDSLNVKWIKKVVERGFRVFPYPAFSPNDKEMPNEIYANLILEKNGIKLKFVQTDPEIGAFENLYSYDKGDLILSKPLYLNDKKKKKKEKRNETELSE